MRGSTVCVDGRSPRADFPPRGHRDITRRRVSCRDIVVASRVCRFADVLVSLWRHLRWFGRFWRLLCVANRNRQSDHLVPSHDPGTLRRYGAVPIPRRSRRGCRAFGLRRRLLGHSASDGYTGFFTIPPATASLRSTVPLRRRRDAAAPIGDQDWRARHRPDFVRANHILTR